MFIWSLKLIKIIEFLLRRANVICYEGTYIDNCLEEIIQMNFIVILIETLNCIKIIWENMILLHKVQMTRVKSDVTRSKYSLYHSLANGIAHSKVVVCAECHLLTR